MSVVHLNLDRMRYIVGREKSQSRSDMSYGQRCRSVTRRAAIPLSSDNP